METQLLMGNEAIARGAVEAGVKVATAYPGTPSSEVFATIAEMAHKYGIEAEWSVNEKVALEVASGASWSGARTIVSMKQVGLNVASDPLMTLAYLGVKGGMVLVVADDPGPHSSQTEQDTRKFASFAKLPVFDPCTPQEARDMVKAAFQLSEKFGIPVILSPTTRTCHVCQDVMVDEIVSVEREFRFEKDPRWVIFPSLSYKRHIWLNQTQTEIALDFAKSPFNKLLLRSQTGIVASGVAYNYLMEACNDLNIYPTILKIGTPYPMPQEPSLEILGHCNRILVLEEQEPVVEEQLIKLAWQCKSGTTIAGKNDRVVPREGELDVDKVKEILIRFLDLEIAQVPTQELPPLPVRTPVLCAGCPHRASFYALKEVGRKLDVVFTGDIGCYTLGTIPPLDMLDTCLCMGAGITQAIGMSKVEPNRKHVAFIGDSTFFHSGIPGLIDAVYNKANIVTVVLDNRTTAMTGHQPHPGMDKNAMGKNEKVLDIARIARACGVELVLEVDPYKLSDMKEAARAALGFDGPAVIIARRECVAVTKPSRKFAVSPRLCSGCEICLKRLGCPAIFIEGQTAVIGGTCFGCGICAEVCPKQAIEEVAL
ncbi:MAG TPA: indolepyruvate ferredoxin oxidoreductase subunit alpha [Verrucomicrobiae bacterium]|nr:indolepyruvate ferredoxin oxidoreductase subunit alpha [Verrucomicrobiae bacterium]